MASCLKTLQGPLYLALCELTRGFFTLIFTCKKLKNDQTCPPKNRGLQKSRRSLTNVGTEGRGCQRRRRSCVRKRSRRRKKSRSSTPKSRPQSSPQRKFLDLTSGNSGLFFGRFSAIKNKSSWQNLEFFDNFF